MSQAAIKLEHNAFGQLVLIDTHGDLIAQAGDTSAPPTEDYPALARQLPQSRSLALLGRMPRQ